MITGDELYSTLRTLDKTQSFLHLQELITTSSFEDSPPCFSPSFDFSEISRFLDFFHADQRYDVIKVVHTTIQEQNERPSSSSSKSMITIERLLSIFNKLREEDGYRTLLVLQDRIDRHLQVNQIGRLLERVADKERFKALKILVEVIEKEFGDKLSIDDITAFVRKLPDFAFPAVVAIKPWVADDLDFTRMRLVLEACSDKNARLEILCELAQVSVRTPATLMCSDLRSMLSTLPQRTAEKGLKAIAHFISPHLDINRVELVLECVMKTDQVKALTALLAQSDTRVNSMKEIKAIVEKMDQPFRGLECLKEKISPTLDLNKISTVLNVIPPIKRLESLQLLVDLTSTANNNKTLLLNDDTKFGVFDVRSALMLMEPSTIVEALRVLLPYIHLTSERDFDRILECFSDATKPMAHTILTNKDSC